jgi:hypothetical protein
VFAWAFFTTARDPKRPRRQLEALHEPGYGGRTRGDQRGIERDTSLYTSARLHPGTALGVGLAMGAAALGLAHFAGFETTSRLRDDVPDALAAFGIGVLASAAMLGLFGLLEPGMPWNEIVGTIAMQSVPASIGAAVARLIV